MIPHNNTSFLLVPLWTTHSFCLFVHQDMAMAMLVIEQLAILTVIFLDWQIHLESNFWWITNYPFRWTTELPRKNGLLTMTSIFPAAVKLASWSSIYLTWIAETSADVEKLRQSMLGHSHVPGSFLDVRPPRLASLHPEKMPEDGTKCSEPWAGGHGKGFHQLLGCPPVTPGMGSTQGVKGADGTWVWAVTRVFTH